MLGPSWNSACYFLWALENVVEKLSQDPPLLSVLLPLASWQPRFSNSVRMKMKFNVLLYIYACICMFKEGKEKNFLHQKAHLLYCQSYPVTQKWAEEHVIYRETVTFRSGVPGFLSVFIGPSTQTWAACFMPLPLYPSLLELNKTNKQKSWKNCKRTWNN